jgi:hypothetical protein
MATREESGVEPSAANPRIEYGKGAWEQQFLDDLIAANRLKNFLVTQGFDIPEPVLKGLAALSERFRREMNEFVEVERKRLWRRSLFGTLLNRLDEIEQP